MGSEGPQLIRPPTHLSRLLSLLSPRLCQVCPGLHLQRRLRQVQLLPLKPTPAQGEILEVTARCLSQRMEFV